MKRMKKLMALVIAVAMVLAMGMSVFAHTISVKDTDTHTYKVFQVLTGTLAESGSKQLGNPAWGEDAIANPGNVNDFIASITANGLSEQDVAQLVAAKVDTTSEGQGTVSADHPLTDLATGYYVLVDVTDLKPTDGKIDTKALHVVQVVNDINGIDIKWGTTEDQKKIVSDTLGQDGEDVNSINGSTDNVSVGDTVNYQITATIPANANKYNYFYFVINDTLDEGLDLTQNSIKVYKDSISDENLLSGTGDNADYTLKTGSAADPKTFQVGLLDAKSLAGKDIIVTYSAVLNEKAKIGEVPNENTSTVDYSNNPNYDYDGEGSPGFPADKDKDAIGETPESVTKTYTTGIEIQKVDQNGAPLTGASFELSGTSTKTVLTVAEEFVADPEGDYYKLTNGKYTKEAPTTEQTMEEAPAGATEGYVEDESGEVEVGGKKYRAYNPETDQNKTIYILVNGNADQYEEGTYKKTETKTATDVKQNHKIELPVDNNGLVRFDGLGAGTYTIKETVTPSGYNTLPDLTVTVSFNAQGEKVWSFVGGDGVYDSKEGIYKIEIENKKGTELPTTGGIGTTIFYIVGAILVVGGGILLVSRRRMSSN